AKLPRWGRSLTPWVKTGLTQGPWKHMFDMDEDSARILSQLLLGAGKSVLGELRSLRHLGPWRELPRRGELNTPPQKQKSWSKGKEAWQKLDDRLSSDNYSPKLYQRVNIALDALGLEYKFH